MSLCSFPLPLMASETTKQITPVPAAKPQEKPLSGKKTQPQDARKSTSAWGVGLGVALPPVRPVAALFHTSLNSWGDVGLRVSGSYLSLAQTFKDAAVESQYASKLTDTDAHLWDASLQAPEVAWQLPLRLFIALAPEVRLTNCRADYTTVAGETLVFSGWGVSSGVNASGGLRTQPRGSSLTLEISAGFTWPLASFGQADLSFEGSPSSGGQTFSDPDLDSMLNSLQPYVQKLTVQPTAGLQLRAGWRF
jgi:hypothetical protein